MPFLLPLSEETNRLEVRDELLATVRKLNEEEGYSLREIAAELLVVASAVVAEETCDLNEVLNYGAHGEGDDITPALPGSGDSMAVNWEAEARFQESQIAQTVNALRDEIARLAHLDRHDQVLRATEKLVNCFIEHARTWMSMVGYTDHYDVAFPIHAEDLMRSCVVTGNRQGFDTLTAQARELSGILDTKTFDIELFLSDLRRYQEDHATFGRILSFLRDNPGFPQRNLFKQLSIQGKRCSYMLDWASRLKIISRERHKDTWLLTVL